MEKHELLINKNELYNSSIRSIWILKQSKIKSLTFNPYFGRKTQVF